jgi:hypothetical protein
MTRRIPATGACFASLYERTEWLDADDLLSAGLVAKKGDAPTTTLAEVLVGLGLEALSPKDERKVRTLIGYAIGAWNADQARPPVKDTKRTKFADPAKGVTSILESLAKQLDAVERVLQAHQTGFKNAHDLQNIHVVSLIQEAMGDLGGRGDYLGDFCQQLHKVAGACHAATKTCEAIPGKPGLDPFDWYTHFTRALKFIAEKNEINPTVIRNGGVVVGPFVDLAEAFERLCPPGMRSPTRDALGKRLERAMEALRSY